MSNSIFGLRLTDKLSPHFTLGEMLVSSTGSRLGIPNIPHNEHIVGSLAVLCELLLEPVRAHYGRPLVVISGYRSPKLNKAVNGAAGSQHVKGEAADFTLPGVSNLEVCRWMQKNTRYDQLIYEFGESGWIHASFGPAMRNQELSAKRVGRLTKYLPGLVA